MDDYGAALVQRATRRALRLERVLWVGGALCGLQIVVSLISLPFDRVRAELMGFFGLTLSGLCACFLAGLHWAHASIEALSRMNLQRSLRTGLLYLALPAFCCPFAGLLLPMLFLVQLDAASRPEQLAPVVTEQEIDGGFRQNAVVAVTPRPFPRPRLWLWFTVSMLTSLLPSVLGSTPLRAPGVSLAAMGLGYLYALRLARQSVGVIRGNLGELQLRFAHKKQAAG